MKARRKHANDYNFPVADGQRFAENAAVSAKSACPKLMTQDGYGGQSTAVLVLGQKGSSDIGRQPECTKVIPRYPDCLGELSMSVYFDSEAIALRKPEQINSMRQCPAKLGKVRVREHVGNSERPVAG